MRERIYLPIVRFGVPHTDWKYVFLVTMLGFVLPFVFGFRIYGVPAPMFTGTIALALSVAFFNFIRLGRRPLWFQHTLRALLTCRVARAALPVDGLNESWLEGGAETSYGKEAAGGKRLARKSQASSAASISRGL